MKVLFLDPEQYVDFENEPSNYQLRLPLLKSGIAAEYRDVIYQRHLRAGGAGAMDEAVRREAADFRPDLVVNSLVWWNECVAAETLNEVRTSGAKILSVFWDTWIDPLPHEMEIFLASDALMIMDSLAGYLKYRMLAERLGLATQVIFSPIGVYTDLVRPEAGAKDIDVLILGSNEGARAELAAYLNDKLGRRGIGFQRLGGLVDDALGTGTHSKSWIDWPAYVRAVNRAKICLSSQTRTDRLQVKGKIFDFLACGAFCLTDANPELARFVPDGVMATYRDPADCVAQIERYLSDEAARDTIARAGRDWFVANYDYASFWKQMRAAIFESGAPPILPGIAETYDETKRAQNLAARTQLAGLNQLVNIVLHKPGARRLSVRALGAYRGFNILNIAERHIVIANGLDIDFMEIDGELYALSPESGLVRLEMGQLASSNQAHTIRAGSVEAAKHIIDGLFR